MLAGGVGDSPKPKMGVSKAVFPVEIFFYSMFGIPILPGTPYTLNTGKAGPIRGVASPAGKGIVIWSFSQLAIPFTSF